MSRLNKIVRVRLGGQSESWLEIYSDRRISYHVENDGYRFLRRGPEARDQWIGLDFIKNYWPHLHPQVEAAIAELRPEEED